MQLTLPRFIPLLRNPGQPTVPTMSHRLSTKKDLLVIAPLSETTKKRLETESTILINRSLAYDPSRLIEFIHANAPKILIIGGEPLRKDVIDTLTYYNTKIIRRGSGISHLPLDYIKEKQISLSSLQGVNAAGLAKFILNTLGTLSPSSKVAIIGLGDIGNRVAKACINQNIKPTVFSPSLKNSESQTVSIAPTLAKALENATHIVITMAVSTTSHQSITKNLIEHGLSNNLQVFTSISDEQVFEPGSILELYKLSHCTVTLDNLGCLDQLKSHIPLSTANYRPGFTISGKAMESSQQELDTFALAKASTLLLSQTQFSPHLIPPSSKPEVTIVGSGLGGLPLAWMLHKKGYPVRIIENRSLSTSEVASMRHLSDTETILHAVTSRTGILDKPATLGGWLSKPLLTASEKKWTNNFNHLIQEPKRHSLITDFNVALNQKGQKLWTELAPHLLDPEPSSGSMTRLYASQEALQAGHVFQQKFNNQATLLLPNQVQNQFPLLESAISTGLLCGGVQLSGASFNPQTALQFFRDSLTSQSIVQGEVVQIASSESGASFTLSNGRSLKAEKLILCPGAYGAPLLKGTALDGKIQGISGLFFEILFAPEFTHSRPFKIHAPEPLGVMNFRWNPAKNALTGSGGFAFTGETTPHAAQIDALRAITHTHLSTLFPQAYSIQHIGTGIRPMTADGTPYITEIKPHIYFSGGTNAAGRVLAFLMANLTERLLSGKPHWMLEVFHHSRKFN